MGLQFQMVDVIPVVGVLVGFEHIDAGASVQFQLVEDVAPDIGVRAIGAECSLNIGIFGEFADGDVLAGLGVKVSGLRCVHEAGIA